MIELAIEQNVIRAVEALKLNGLRVAGVWGAAADGEVYRTEAADGPARLVVRVSPRVFRANALSEVSFDITFALSVRVDLCATAGVSAFVQPIVELLQSWNLGLHAGTDDDFGFCVPGFLPGGMHFAGGSAPDLDRESAVWEVAFNVVLSGVVQRKVEE